MPTKQVGSQSPVRQKRIVLENTLKLMKPNKDRYLKLLCKGKTVRRRVVMPSHIRIPAQLMLYSIISHDSIYYVSVFFYC